MQKEVDPATKLTRLLDKSLKDKNELQQGGKVEKRDLEGEERYKKHLLIVIENIFKNYTETETETATETEIEINSKKITFIKNILNTCENVISTRFIDDLNLKEYFKKIKEIIKGFDFQKKPESFDSNDEKIFFKTVYLLTIIVKKLTDSLKP
ncbi:MAG: hypothetical protein AAB732_02465 [Patescibacteria group bacterium]